MTEIIQPIPARLKNIAVGGHVAGADQIIDDQKNKTQETINSEVDTALNSKANKSEMSIIEGAPGSPAEGKATITLKQGVSATVLTKHQDISGKANTSDVNTALSGKQDVISDLSTIRSGAAAGATAQQPATTLAGYGITDAYTKEEINDHIDTPNQGYITAVADSNTTTANLKTLIDTAAGGNKEKADFIYRVGCWDGSQYNDTMYSEYAWIDGTYALLSKKSQVDEVFDISAYHANTKYADLTAALGTGGANIPESLRKGGMSVKFVQSSDNKYVQFRCMTQNFTTDVTQWQGVDDEPTAGSENLVKSGGVTKALFELYKNGVIFEGDAQESFFDNVFEEGITYTITSLNSVNCSLAFKDANGNVLDLHYLGPNQAYTFTFNIPNCATFGGYTAGDTHYKLRLKVSSFQALNSAIDRITQDSFEKGNIDEYGKNDTYKELSRARSLGIRNSGNVSISIKALQQVSQTASFIIFYYDAKGTYLNSEVWKDAAIIPAYSYYRLLLSLDPYASEEHTDSLSVILSAFSINPVDDGIEVLSNNWKTLFVRGTTDHDGVVSTDWRYKSRVCTAKKIKTDKDIFVRYKSGYYDLRLWSSDGSTLLYEKNWWEGEITNDNFIPAGSVFTMNITPDREAGQDDYYTLDQIFACVSLENVICTNSVSIPKTILQCRNVDDSRFPPYTKYYIQASVKNQYDRVRVNVRKTTDGVFWCCHDDTINAEARNSDGSQISETIQTEGHTYAELSAYDWGIKYGPLYAGLTPPKFEDVCKFCSYFNIPLTIETSTIMSEQDINTMFTLLETYGLVKDLIIITSAGSNWNEMNMWKQRSKYISFFVGGTYAELSSWVDTINSYKTGYNNIYIMIFPFGEHADSNLRTLCSENDWLIYDSAIMSKWDLRSYGFNRGISLLEANNVYMIKTNIQNYADSNV